MILIFVYLLLLQEVISRKYQELQSLQIEHQPKKHLYLRDHSRHQQLINNTSSSYYKQQQAGGKQNGLSSPFNIFLNNDDEERYYTDAKVISNYQGYDVSSNFKVSIDINMPFIFLTEKRGPKYSLHFTKLIPTEEQIELIVQYMKPKFIAIEAYSSDVFYVLNSSFWINQYIGTDVGFFYLIGYGAEVFQKKTSLDGYVGLGKKSETERTELNYVILLNSLHLINSASYALYIGNSPGNIDSDFFLGGYQDFFIQNETSFQELKMIQGCSQSWCFKVNQIIMLKNDTQIFGSSPTRFYTSYISSTYQFIFIPNEIADTIKFHIEQDDTIECEFSFYPTQDRNNTVLQCSTKLQISIPQKFPIINFIIQQHSEQILITLTPEQYIEKCLDDVETYAFKCFTYFAIYDEKIDQFKPNFDIIFGLPFLRVYYTYYDLQNSSLFITKAYYYEDISLISKFWYYSFMALLVCWALVMMSCGIFFKDQMDQMIIFVINILKYLSGNQQARQQVLMDYLADDE